MPRKILPRIAAMSAGEKPMTLRIRWDKGDESVVDISGLIETFRLSRAVAPFAGIVPAGSPWRARDGRRLE
jgi:hypothetical protein